MNMKKHLLTSSSLAVVILIAASNAAQKNISKITGLRAVTEFDGIEDFYYDLYKKKEGTEPLESSDPSTKYLVKREICAKVFSSPYFKIRRQVKEVDVEDMKIVYTLFYQYRPIFDAIYKPSEGFHERYRYVNPYTPHSFLYKDEHLRDHMFVCVVKGISSESQNIEQYLVSREYDVNLARGRSPIAGRFIFAVDGADLQIRALAEEYALSSELVNRVNIAEYKYIKHRQIHIELGTPEMDPVCKLSPSNKLRVCVSIFASKILRRKYEFTPEVEHVEKKCKKKRVSFVRSIRVRLLFKMKRRYFNKRRQYEEWMYGCRARRIGSDEKVTYYVSRGDAKNTVFAYKYYISDEKILVKHYFKNVSVVDSTTINMLDLSTGRDTADDDGHGEGDDTDTTINNDGGDEIRAETSTSRRELNHRHS